MDTAPTEIYPYEHTLSLHHALPSSAASSLGGRAALLARRRHPRRHRDRRDRRPRIGPAAARDVERRPVIGRGADRSEEHTSELQSLMRISYAVFCLKKKNEHKHRVYRTLVHIATVMRPTHNC